MSFPFGQYVNTSAQIGQVNIAEGKNIDRIGIEGKPGMSFELNGELLTLGRNGCYEVETTISSLVINLQNTFLVNYHIKE